MLVAQQTMLPNTVAHSLDITSLLRWICQAGTTKLRNERT